jgi:hypothetical protein
VGLGRRNPLVPPLAGNNIKDSFVGAGFLSDFYMEKFAM